MSKKTVELPKIKAPWYVYITPLLGVKWAAEVTLIGYTWIARADSDGLRLACIIVAVFLFIEWAQLAWCDFKRRAQ